MCLKNIRFIYIAVLFLLAGCAHRPATVPPAENAASALLRNPETISEGAGNTLTGAANIAAAPHSAETSPPDEIPMEKPPGDIADPIAPWNRAMFHFNDKLYFWFLKPMAKGYRAVVPQPVRTGVQNFFTNLATPIRLVGCLMQGKGKAAGYEFSRFLFNTTVGVLGFGNPAKNYPKLNPPEEDFGQTLGSYGIGNGFYIIWPFLGPSSLRDSIGRLGDFFLYPVSYIRPLEAWIAVRGTEAVNEISFRIGDYEAFKDAAIFPYEAFRDAYIQHRKKKVEE